LGSGGIDPRIHNFVEVMNAWSFAPRVSTPPVPIEASNILQISQKWLENISVVSRKSFCFYNAMFYDTSYRDYTVTKLGIDNIMEEDLNSLVIMITEVYVTKWRWSL
jgi:hypothetical protein